MLGTNDSGQNWNADDYEKDLEAFASVYQSLESSPTVYLMTCPPAFESALSPNGEVIENEIASIIKRVAGKMGVQMIDIFSAFYNRADLFPDGIHPNEKGATIIAETVYQALMLPSITAKKPVMEDGAVKELVLECNERKYLIKAKPVVSAFVGLVQNDKILA
jgi:lysophospholipase L1-like esterase